MPAIRSIAAVAATFASLSLTAVPPSYAAQTDPEVIIYRFPGVLDSGGAVNTGVVTAFHCTNFSGVTETVRIVVRAAGGLLVANVAFAMTHLATTTASTRASNLYFDDQLLNAAGISQGTAAIAATSLNIICTAVTLDAASTVPNGFALRGIRFSPVPGSQE